MYSCFDFWYIIHNIYFVCCNWTQKEKKSTVKKGQNRCDRSASALEEYFYSQLWGKWDVVDFVIMRTLNRYFICFRYSTKMNPHAHTPSLSLIPTFWTKVLILALLLGNWNSTRKPVHVCDKWNSKSIISERRLWFHKKKMSVITYTAVW